MFRIDRFSIFCAIDPGACSPPPRSGSADASGEETDPAPTRDGVGLCGGATAFPYVEAASVPAPLEAIEPILPVLPVLAPTGAAIAGVVW